MPCRLSTAGVLALALTSMSFVGASSAAAQRYAYPVAYPRAGGGVLVAVPIEPATIEVYRLSGARNSVYDTPMPSTPEATFSDLAAGEPIVLRAPLGTDTCSACPGGSTCSACLDEDHFFLLFSTGQLVLSMADDERLEAGSPDRIFFMPTEGGTFRGQTFYSGVKGSDGRERIRVTNPTAASLTADIAAWDGSAWVMEGAALTVPAGATLAFDPALDGPYRVTTDADALVVIGYLGDNATAPAVDTETGRVVGEELFGYGDSVHLRAISDLTYVIETRPEDATTWTEVATGSLLADEAFADTFAGGGDGYLRARLTGGVAWAIVGTASLLDTTEWNGYFLPAQTERECFLGERFFTNSSARTISVLPNAGTTVRIFDETSGAMIDEYTSTGAWEFHNFFHPDRVRVELSGGPASVLLVGTLNVADCEEATNPGRCGILEGGYSVPAVGGFFCGEFSTTPGECTWSADTSCVDAPPMMDAGVPSVDAGPPPSDAGTDSGPAMPMDAGPPPDPTPGCGCRAVEGAPGPASLFGIGLAFVLFRRRRRAVGRGQTRSTR